MRKIPSPVPDSAGHAAVVARATALIEHVRRIGPKLAPRKREEIERRLATVHRLLDRLGYRGTA